MPQMLPTINVCFPRSGHRFLRNILSAYFGKEFKFRENHQKTGYSFEEANYIKDHDFGIRNNNIGIQMLPKYRYLIQYRHPLESLVSYFEFFVKHERVTDDRESWNLFFPQQLDYWKRFVDKWLISVPGDMSLSMHSVVYSKLYGDTYSSVEQVINFLTNNQSPINTKRLNNTVTRIKLGF